MKLRNERLKEVIREEAAQTITQDLADPRLGFCTVTRVDLTNDLSYCTIHVSVLGGDPVKSRTMKALQHARGLIQSKIAGRLKTRTTPHVTIELDESIERSFAVLNKIKEARASDPDKGHSTPDFESENDGEEDPEQEANGGQVQEEQEPDQEKEE